MKKTVWFISILFALSGCAILQNPANGLTSSDTGTSETSESSSLQTFQPIANFRGALPSWTPAVDRGTYANHQSADLNGDGREELLLSSGGNVVIYSVDSSGNFTDTGFQITGLWSFFEVTDFDGDGNIDVVGLNSGTATVSIYFGDGAMGFTAGPSESYQSVAEQISGIAFGDFNSDGNPDLIATRQNGTDDVMICAGGGVGRTLAALGSCAVIALAGSDTPANPQVAFMNGDANSDVVIALQGTDEVFIATGDGALGFANQLRVTLTAGSTPNNLAIGDLNGDTFPDVAVSTTGNDEMMELIFADDGTATAYTLQANVNVDEDTGAVVIVDIDSDGTNEVAILSGDQSTHESPGVKIYSNDGSGNLTLSQDLNIGGRFFWQVDGSAGLDIVGTANNGFVFYSNTSGVLYDNYPNSYPITATTMTAFEQGDWDGDGDTDFVIADDGTDTVRLMINDGNGSFSNGSTFATSSNPVEIVVGDFNNDDFADFSVIDTSNTSMRVFLNDQTGSFTSPFGDSDLGDSASKAAVADFDEDGNLDIVVFIGNATNVVQILLGDGAGDFSFGNSYSVSNVNSISVGDLDNDDHMDIVACSSGTSRQFNGDGAGVFAASNLVGSGGCGAGTIADFDNDDFADYAYAKVFSWQLDMFINDGSGRLSTLTSYSDEAFSLTNGMVSLDIDQDGNMDWVTTYSDIGVATISYGDGAGAHDHWEVLPIGRGNLGVMVGDYNGDYLYDLAFVSEEEGILQISFGE